MNQEAPKKKSGSLLGKLILLIVLAVILGVPAHMVHYGRMKTDADGKHMFGEPKWPWEWSAEERAQWMGAAKTQLEDAKDVAADKWADLKKEAEKRWAQVKDKLTTKATAQTEQLFIHREAIQKELAEMEKALKPEDQRDEREQSIGYGITAFANALQEWEAALQWSPEQNKAAFDRIRKQLDLAVSNFESAKSGNASDKIGEMTTWAKKYKADFDERLGK